MREEEVVKASDRELMSPDERQRLFDEHVMIAVAKVPPAFLERARTKGRSLLAARGPIDPLQK